MLEIGPLIIDFSPLLDAAARSALYAGWYIFTRGGWVLIAAIGIHYFLHWWVNDHIWDKKYEEWDWTLLAIDVPKENIQTPLSVENILAHLAGAHQTPDLFELAWEGFAQEWFSLEIASIDGRVQYYVHTPTHMRDLVEAAIYAQYPNAEISETEDYAQNAPTNFPNPDWNCWGTEWKLVRSYPYPLRTYVDFQDETAEEAGFKDPMAALLETMGGLLPGEQLWFQILIEPIEANSWQPKSYRLVDKMAGKAGAEKESVFEKVLSAPFQLLGQLWNSLVSNPTEETRRKDTPPPSQVLYLTSGEAEIIKAIERKAAKIGFAVKIRGVYLSRKDLWSKARGRYGLIGAIKQVNTENLNALKPETKIVGTHAHYFFTDWRKNWKRRKIVRAYKNRSIWSGLDQTILNIEELATLWHFPVTESTRAPLLKKAEVRRSEPPIELPMEEGGYGSKFGSVRRARVARGASPPGLPEEEAGGIPGNLPVG